jgi:hypothetical protein
MPCSGWLIAKRRHELALAKALDAQAYAELR